MANLRFIYRVECFVGGDEWAEFMDVRIFDSLQESRVWAFANQTFRLGGLAAIVDCDFADPLMEKLYYDGWFSVPSSCPDVWKNSDEFKPSLQLLQNAVSRLSELGFVELSMKVLNRLHELYPAIEGGVKYAL